MIAVVLGKVEKILPVFVLLIIGGYYMRRDGSSE